MTKSDFWDKIATKYAARPISDQETYEKSLTHIHAHLKPTDHLLEIGCGTGSTALKLAPYVDRVTATDYAQGMLTIARAKLGEDAPDNVTFHHAAADDAHPGAPFDVICAFNLLHLVPDPAATIRHLHDELKPGGIFITKTPSIGDLPFLIRRVMIPAMRLIGKAPFLNESSNKGLLETLENTGFTLLETQTFGKKHYYFGVARRS